MSEWTSIRNAWPDSPGDYEVQDCRYNAIGRAHYDGYDWMEWKPHNDPYRGSLMLVQYYVTHWRSKRCKRYWWIKVADQLPSPDQQVLCFGNTPQAFICDYTNFGDKSQCCEFYSRDWHHNEYRIKPDITHWMPLPRTPDSPKEFES